MPAVTSISHRGRDEAKRYVEAAHIGLSALGCVVPPAPFGLYLIIQEAVVEAGPKPSATSHLALGTWREQLTDSIMAQILPPEEA